MAAALPYVAAGASIIGGLVGASGASQAASSQAGAAMFNADMMGYRAQLQEQQAKILERNRQIALDSAGLAAKDMRVRSAAQLSQIRAAYGSSGLALDGSPLDVLQASAQEGELDVEKVLYKGDVEGAQLTDEARMVRTSAALTRAQGDLLRWGAGQSLIAGRYAAAAALISGISGGFRSVSGTGLFGSGSGVKTGNAV